MIKLGPNAEATAPVAPVGPLRVVGVGGAGLALLERLGPGGVWETVAVHTDAQALMASSSARKVQLGREAAKGLGAGGDPSLGAAAAQESAGELRGECGAPLVVVCAGLGGGTGSGAAPVVAQAAKREGALVLGVVTMPFEGEGGRRREQAEEALSKLGRYCAAVICFENDRMSEVAPGEAPVAEAFAAAGEVMAGAVRAIARMVNLPSVLHVGVDELAQLFRGMEARCHFGHGVGQGADRVREAVRQALASPLLEKSAVLSGAGSVLVHLTGGPDLSLAEMQAVLQQIRRQVDEASQLLLGVSTDPEVGDRLGVTIMAARVVGSATDYEDTGEDEDADPHGVTGEGAAGPDAEKPAKAGAKRGKVGKKGDGVQTQEELPLDQAMRGRFKDLDPTMVDGQDLDIPAFIRMRIRLK